MLSRARFFSIFSLSLSAMCMMCALIYVRGTRLHESMHGLYADMLAAGISEGLELLAVQCIVPTGA
jgi:hypothetical protein